MTKTKATEIYKYLQLKNLGFVFYNGILVDREQLLTIINK